MFHSCAKTSTFVHLLYGNKQCIQHSNSYRLHLAPAGLIQTPCYLNTGHCAVYTSVGQTHRCALDAGFFWTRATQSCSPPAACRSAPFSTSPNEPSQALRLSEENSNQDLHPCLQMKRKQMFEQQLHDDDKNHVLLLRIIENSSD